MPAPHSGPPIRTVTFGFYAGEGMPRPMDIPDQHNEIELNYIESGAMLFERGCAAPVTLGEGTLTIYWAALPHRVLTVRPGTQISWGVIPLHQFLEWNLPESLTQPLLEKTQMLCYRAGEFGGPIPLRRWADDFHEVGLRKAIRLEMEAFFSRLGFATRAPLSFHKPVPETTPVQAGHIEKIVRYITAHFREPLTVEAVAKQVGLSPGYAMRLFEQRWGTTLGAFLLEQRLLEARRLLASSDLSVAEVSFACGFGSMSRFYQAFGQACGMAPGGYRRAQRERFPR